NGFEWKLGHNQYFVMGDNRLPNGSTDSRVFGPIELDRIKGVANFRFYPFSGFGLLK
ncbi:S26 family signal peptidase, partial [Helcococcus ovis]